MPEPRIHEVQFIELANIVARHNVKFFIETDAGGSPAGLECAARLGLYAHIRSADHAVKLSGQFPDADIYDGDLASFLGHVLPLVTGNALFWLQSDDEMSLIKDAESEGKEWFCLPKYPLPDPRYESNPEYSLGN